MRTVSIVIPAYNEEAFIGRLLEQIAAVPTEQLGFRKEIVVVDDGSRDQTFEVASRCHFPGIRVFKQVPNQGKGRAVQRGIRECTGEFVLVQDADLEYDPNDYLPLLAALQGEERVAVYGSRTLGQIRRRGRRSLFPGRHEDQSLGPWVAGVVLSAWTFALYRRWISDTLTAYKLYPTAEIRKMTIRTHGFETDHEITSKLIKAGIPIREVPIGYQPRTEEEGKKIRARDGWVALWTLWRFRKRD